MDAESRREVGGRGMLASQKDSVERNFRGHFGNNNPQFRIGRPRPFLYKPALSPHPLLLIGDRRSAFDRQSFLSLLKSLAPDSQHQSPVNDAISLRSMGTDARHAAPVEGISQSPARLPPSARGVALAADFMGLLDIFRIDGGLPLVGSGWRPANYNDRFVCEGRRKN